MADSPCGLLASVATNNTNWFAWNAGLFPAPGGYLMRAAEGKESILTVHAKPVNRQANRKILKGAAHGLASVWTAPGVCRLLGVPGRGRKPCTGAGIPGKAAAGEDFARP